MDIRQNLNSWLKNPKRDYASGLSLFNALARPDMKGKYGEFLNAAKEEERKSNSMKMNLLTNKLTQINRAINLNPALFAEAFAQVMPSTAEIVKDITELKTRTEELGSKLHKVTYLPEGIGAKKTELQSKTDAINTLSTEKETISSSLTSLQGEEKPDKKKIEKLEEELKAKDAELQQLNADKEALESDISDLEDQLAQVDEDKEELQRQYTESTEKVAELKEQLEQKGLKVIADEDLPEELQAKRIRIKEIVPLMAVIHSEMASTTLTDDERKAKAQELCELDDERRAYWDAVDDFLKGEDSVIIEERKLEYSQDPIVKGMQIATRIKRLKENIARSEKSAKDNQERKPNIAAKATMRAEEYKKELQELENLINGDQ